MTFDLYSYIQQDAVLDLTDCLPVRGSFCLERPELGKAPWETGEAAFDVLSSKTFHCKSQLDSRQFIRPYLYDMSIHII